MRRRLVFSLILIAVLTATLNIKAIAATRCVNPDGSSSCDSIIQDAINASVSGDTILIYPGTYHESITTDKRLTMMGLGGPGEVNLIAPTQNAVTIAASVHVWISNLTITALGGNGIYSSSFLDTVYVRNCVITGCSGAGIHVSSRGTWFVSNCVVFNNSQEGFRYPGGGCCTVYNVYLDGNIIFQNSGAGISLGFYLGRFNEYNCVFDNNPNYADEAEPGTGDIQLDPVFISADSGDFHLQSSSPCIDTGRPGPAYLDCDGSFNDMGVYGGPYAWCGPGPVVTDLQIIPSTVVRGETFRIQATGVSR